jgi:hypothetical protein
MPHDNVEIVRRFVEGYNATGVPPWEEMDPEVVWIIDPGRRCSRPPLAR